VTYLAITVLGHDRPGIIAQTAEVLAEAGMNLEDSSMTLLRGHFAMTLICQGSADAARIAASLGPLEGDGSLTVSVREIPAEPDGAPGGRPFLVTVHGADRLGIVAQLAGVIADAGGNITDLTTRLVGELYVLVAEVDLPTDMAVAELEATLAEIARSLGVGVTLRPMERDEL
jgi:glycine cleavage system transcriptional repressor